MGMAAQRLAPLQDPGVFARFKKEMPSASIFERMPPEVASGLLAIQKDRGPRKPLSSAKVTVLIVSGCNWHFVPPLAHALKATAGASVRHLDFTDCEIAIDALNKAHKNTPTMLELLFGLGPAFVSEPEARSTLARAAPWASELIEWADVVFVEWWNTPAIFFSKYLDPAKYLFIRCHRFEAFRPKTHFSNMRGVDGAIFVGDHIRRIFNAVFSDLMPSAVSSKIIGNIPTNSKTCHLVISQETKFTLGMMKYADTNKDPLFAIAILRHLLEHDARWVLKFIGPPWTSDG